MISLLSALVPSFTWLRRFVPAVLLLGLAGCAERDGVSVKLQARPQPNRGALRLEIQAQVTGPLSGLRYRWLSVSGQCYPQESDLPATIFQFAEGVTRDQVTVEVLREGRPVAVASLPVRYEEAGPYSRVPAAPPPDVAIEINQVPPWDVGGADTRADIGGRVTGNLTGDYRIVIYARAYNSWFIQPAAQAVHLVAADGTWATWTHKGEVYAVLLVRPGYVPLPRLDMLPQPGGDVLARAIVDGKR